MKFLRNPCSSYFVVMAAGVLAITYLPALSTALGGLRH
jgi:hypothetical protein